MDDRNVTPLWEMYENGRSYQSACKMSSNLPKYVRFYEGDQWPPATKNTASLPRPVFNIIEMICRNKQSAILSVPAKIVYKAEDQTADVEMFNRFAEYIQKEYGQERLDKEAIEEGCKKGTYIYHYYWDAEGRGKDGVKEGALRCELIDPLNIFFANPAERDCQKQKWILIASREDVESVKAKCDRNVDKDDITSDESESKYGEKEQQGNQLCTVLTRYFRKGGEVWCEKATKTVMVNKAFPITPNVEAAERAILSGDEDAPNNSLPDKGDDTMINDEKMTLYPIVVGQYKRKEKSIYGRGEVENLIPNQRIINFLIAMSTLNAQEVAWGKYIVRPDALRGQEINNKPGQVLTDYSKEGNGIRKMTEQVIQSTPVNLVDTITTLTRACAGATEVMTGEVVGSNMSGAAIAQLQSQAQQPIEELRNTFWLVKEEQGRVLEQFFKFYYLDRDFSYEEEIDEEKTVIAGKFSGEAYRKTMFDVVVEATAGTNASAAGDINALDILISKGLISVEAYLAAYPNDAISNKSELLKAIRKEKEDKVNILNSQVEQLTAQLQQSTEIIRRQKSTVDSAVSVLQENMRLKAQILQLQKEYRQKIDAANQQIELGNRKISETMADASEMAQTIVKAANGAPIIIE